MAKKKQNRGKQGKKNVSGGAQKVNKTALAKSAVPVRSEKKGAKSQNKPGLKLFGVKKEQERGRARVKMIEKSANGRGIITVPILALLIVVAIVTGVVVGVANHRTEDIAAVEEESPAEEPEEPEEPELPTENPDPLVEEPTGVEYYLEHPDEYKVAAYKPRFISIPAAGLSRIPVTEIGTTMLSNGGAQLDSPASPRVVGWYYISSLPGQAGTALMNAHGGDLGIGIFKTLPRVNNGDKITIEMGDGRTFTYRIVEKTYKYLGAESDAYMGTVLDSPVPGTPSLTLITCTGTWLPAQQTYDQRLFVKALLE